MPVKITNRTYTNQFKPASTTNFQIGNVGDWLRLTLDCQFAVEKRFDITDSLTINDPNQLILNDGTNWGDWGFDVGMSARLTFDVLDLASGTTFPNTIPFTITNITGGTLEANLTTWGYQYGQIAPIRNADLEVKNVLVFTNQFPQGIKVKYTNLSNNNVPSGSLNSHIDGTETIFVAEDTDLTGVGQKYEIFTPNLFDHNLTPFQSGMSVEKISAEYVGAQGHKKNYRIYITYMLSPFYDDINNLLDRIAPDVVRGVQAVTDSIEIEGLPVYNNPNVVIKNDPRETAKLGNTGWFDENFNQLPNPFTFTPVVYKNLAGTTVNQLDHANPITITTTISGITNIASSKVQYGFIWASINEEDWQQTDYPFHQNLKVSTGGEADGMNDVFDVSPIVNSPFPLLRLGYSSDGATMDASDISFVQNGADLDVSITFRPNAAFTTFMEALSDNERQYAIWISIGDPAPTSNKTDRVSLLLDVGTMDTLIEPIGQFAGLTIDFLDHPQDENDTPIICGNSIYLEDDLLAKVSFQIDTAVSAIIPIPTAITFGVLVERASDGLQYILDSNEVDLSIYPDPTQFNFDVSRGFKLGIDNNKNYFKVEHDPTGDSGTLKGVLGLYGFKVRWEDWIKRTNVPTDFYDNTEKQNGLNNDWFHYFEVAGWKLTFFVNIAATLNGQNVVYQNLKEFTVKGYDVNSNITTEIKYYRNVVGTPDTKGVQLTTGDPLLGVIVQNEIVWLDIEYTRLSGTWVDQPTVDANTYATSNSEVDEGSGQFQFRQLSSIWDSEFDNPMIPIPGETLCKVTFVSTTLLRVECRIDSNKLIDSNRYKITGRLGCK